jgi:hypothetical protein
MKRRHSRTKDQPALLVLPAILVVVVGKFRDLRQPRCLPYPLPKFTCDDLLTMNSSGMRLSLLQEDELTTNREATFVRLQEHYLLTTLLQVKSKQAHAFTSRHMRDYTVSPEQILKKQIYKCLLFLMRMRIQSTENLFNADLQTKLPGRFHHASVLSRCLHSAKQAILSAIHAPWLLVMQRWAVGTVRSQSCSFFGKPKLNEQNTHATRKPVPPTVSQSSIPTATENDIIDDSAAAAGLSDTEREFVTGNEIPRIVVHRCTIEASIGKRIVQTIEAPHRPGHRSNHRAAHEAT